MTEPMVVPTLPYELSITNHYFWPRRLFAEIRPGTRLTQAAACHALASAILNAGLVNRIDRSQPVMALIHNATYAGMPAEPFWTSTFDKHSVFRLWSRPADQDYDNAYWKTPEIPPDARFVVAELNIDAASDRLRQTYHELEKDIDFQSPGHAKLLDQRVQQAAEQILAQHAADIIDAIRQNEVPGS